MPGEVLGRRADGHTGLEDLKANLGPLANGLKRDSAVDQCLSELTASGLKRIRADRDWPWSVRGVEECDGLRRKRDQLCNASFRSGVREAHTSSTGNSSTSFSAKNLL